MPLPQTRYSVIDALGMVQQTIADLKFKEKRLTAEVSRMGVGYHSGRLYTATVAAAFDKDGGVQVSVTMRVKP